MIPELFLVAGGVKVTKGGPGCRVEPGFWRVENQVIFLPENRVTLRLRKDEQE